MADHYVIILFATIAASLIYYCYTLWGKNNKLRIDLADMKKEQEALIAEFETTVQQVEDSKEQLFENNRLLKDLLSTISHDIQSPLKFLHLSSKTLDELISARDYDKIDSIPTALRNSIHETLIFVTELSNWIKSIDKDYKLPLESVNLHKTLNEIELFFDELFKDRNNKFHFKDIDQELNVRANKELVKIIIRNIIDNANKNSSNNLIKISVNQDREYCTITIIDSGTGIPADRLSEINQVLIDNRLTVPGLQSNSGHGYKLIAHFSKLMGITVTIESNPGEGTKVELRGFTLVHRPIEYMINNFTHP